MNIKKYALCKASVLICILDSQCIYRCSVIKIQTSASHIERSQLTYFSNAIRNAQLILILGCFHPSTLELQKVCDNIM